MSRTFVLTAMVFCHVLGDFPLQSVLADMKRKSWWEEHEPDGFYHSDWVMALLMHAASWSFLVLLPVAAFRGFDVRLDFGLFWAINTAVHALVDDLKANRHSINLICDQLLHLAQMAVTFVALT